jgi:fluoroquinolone resistance protein
LRGSVLTAFDAREVELRDAIITSAQAVELAEALHLRVGDA